MFGWFWSIFSGVTCEMASCEVQPIQEVGAPVLVSEILNFLLACY